MGTKILDSMLDAIGHTPMVRIRTVGAEHGCELLGKCEFMNAGGSVKDRIGRRMLLEAEKAGRIKPGDTLIEPTSGNTGIGLALAAAIRGYRMLITMPEKMSQEKQVVLEALGAEIIRTPTEASFDSPESHISVAKQLQETIAGTILDQYGNQDNPMAHYEETAAEILEQCDGKLDYFVAGAGTGGTITGVGKRLKEAVPGVKIIGVDPVGSILAGPAPVQSYKVEGIGYDFIPDVLDRSVVDEWIKSDDRESFVLARQLIRREGMLVGGSSGSAMYGAIQIAKREPGTRIVVLLPDSVRNYMSKFMDDQWMKQFGFSEGRWEQDTIGDMMSRMDEREVITAALTDTVADVIKRMKKAGISQLPVIEPTRKVLGIVTESDLLNRLVDGHASMDSKIAEVMYRQCRTVERHHPAAMLLDRFSHDEVGVVVDDNGLLIGLVTKMDVVEHLTGPGFGSTADLTAAS